MKEIAPGLPFLHACEQACKNSLDRLKQAGLLNSHDPQVFLPRMGNVVNIIVGDDCWFDRDELRKKLD